MSTQPPLPPPSPDPDKDAIINGLRREASRDFLTGAYHARYFRELLTLEAARARRYKVPLSLLMGDIDKFKQVNDSFGHFVGDKVLITIAELIRASVRMTDFVCRIGGDEMAIILTHTVRYGARRVGENLKNRIENFNYLPDELRDLAVSVTFAVVQYESPESSDSFILRAEQALYRAKKKGFGIGMDDEDPDEGLLGVPVRV